MGIVGRVVVGGSVAADEHDGGSWPQGRQHSGGGLEAGQETPSEKLPDPLDHRPAPGVHVLGELHVAIERARANRALRADHREADLFQRGAHHLDPRRRSAHQRCSHPSA